MIKQKIRKTVNNSNIDNFKLNYRLIMCLFIAKEFLELFNSYYEVNDN